MGSVKQFEVAERKRKEKLEREHKLIEGIDYKICSIHNKFFPEENPWFPATTEYFYHSENKTDHLHPNCKRCGIKKTQKWVEDNPEWAKELMKEANDNPNPLNNAKEYHRFNSQRRWANGKQQAWFLKNPGKHKEYTENHKEHDIYTEEWLACLKIFNNQCAYCGLPAEDHIIKRSKKYIIMELHKEHVDNEGYNDIRNGVPACRSCNSSKRKHNINKWYTKQKFFNQDKYNKILWWTTEGYKDYIVDKPPYRIVKKKNKDNNKFHHELWSVDEMRNFVEIITTEIKKEDINTYIINNNL